MKRKFEFYALKGGSSSDRDDNSTEAHQFPVIIQPSEFHKCSECGQVFRSKAALLNLLEDVSVSADKKEGTKVEDQSGNNNAPIGEAGPSVLAAPQPAVELRLLAAEPAVELRLFAEQPAVELPAVELRLFEEQPAVELRLFAEQPAVELRLFTDPLELTLRPPPAAAPPRPQPLDLNLPAESDV